MIYTDAFVVVLAKIREARQILQTESPYVSVRSGCELLVRFMTLAQSELEQTSVSQFDSFLNYLTLFRIGLFIHIKVVRTF